MNPTYKVLGELIVFFGLIFLVPYLFLLIWNYVMPSLCGFNEITYWQSFLLGIGLRLINGSSGLRRLITEKD